MAVLIRHPRNKEYPPRMIEAKAYQTLGNAQRAIERYKSKYPSSEFWVAIGPDGLFYPMQRGIYETGEASAMFHILPQAWCN